MNPLGGRARAEELARLLEGSSVAPGAQTSNLLALAGRLRAVAPALDEAVPLRPEFRAQLRQRLVAVATVQGASLADVPAPLASPGTALERAVSWSRSWTAQKRLAAVSGAMAGVVAVTGVAVAASHSLPGQPFYGVKRASEGLQLSLAGSDTEKGTKHLEFAATRLREVRALAHGESQLSLGRLAGSGVSASGSGLQDRIVDTLEDFATETRDGRELLEGVYRRTGKTEPLEVLREFAAQQEQRLSVLIPDLPPGTANAAQESLTLVDELATDAAELLAIGTCGASCDPDTAGPQLPVEPGPTPGSSATPPSDDNGAPDCSCVQPSPTPDPTAEPSEQPTAEPTTEPTATPTRSPRPTSSPTSGGLPLPLPTGLPLPLPTDLPTLLPTLPPLPLPVPLPTELPLLPPLSGTVAVKP